MSAKSIPTTGNLQSRKTPLWPFDSATPVAWHKHKPGKCVSMAGWGLERITQALHPVAEVLGDLSRITAILDDTWG